jgi:hypothetical protein
MREAFVTLNPLAVLAVAFLGFFLGWLWYSKFLFARAWMKEMNFTKEQVQCMKSTRGALSLAGAFCLTLLSTTALAFFINEHHIVGPLPGLKMGLFLGLGFCTTRYTVNSIFQMKSLKLYLIVAGYDIFLFAAQGAILGVWR